MQTLRSVMARLTRFEEKMMSQAHYDRLLARIELYEKLGEAEMLDAAGEEGIAHDELMKRLRQKLTPTTPAYNSHPDP